MLFNISRSKAVYALLCIYVYPLVLNSEAAQARTKTRRTIEIGLGEQKGRILSKNALQICTEKKGKVGKKNIVVETK